MVAASKPTSWLFMQLHILLSTKLKFGTLTGGLGCLPFDNEAYPPLSDSCGTIYGIRILIVVGTPVRAREQSVIYPRKLLRKAIPKDISKRTSYHWV